MSKSTTDEATPGRAIITYARGWQSLAAVRSLGRRGIEVIVGDEYGLTPSSFSRYATAKFRYPSLAQRPGEFLDVLEETVLTHKPDDPSVPYVLMPIHKETYLIAEHRERFAPHIRVPVPDVDHIRRVHNKGKLAAFAAERGLPIPRTWLPRAADDLDAWRQEMTFPVFVKLREAASGVGIRKTDSFDKMRKTFAEFIERYRLSPEDYPIVQQAVPGDDYCVTTLFDHGEPRACMTYRNVRVYPAERGASVLRETIRAPAMEKIALETLGPIGWHGVAELDFRWTGDDADVPVLIEVNPRFWGGLIQAIESGCDYPWLLFRLAVDGKVDVPEEVRLDVRTETPILGLLATLRDISHSDRHMRELRDEWRGVRQEYREGSKRAALRKLIAGLGQFVDVKGRADTVKRMLEVHKHNVYDVLSREDPKPVLGVLYPLAVFLKHGKVNLELLTSEGDVQEEEEDTTPGGVA